MKILVNFGDSDFYSVLMAFGDLLVNSDLPHPGRQEYAPGFLTRERIADWFNATAFTFYQALQNRGNYEGAGPQYFRVTPDKVFLGQAVEKRLRTMNQWRNGEAVLIDLSKKTVEII